MTTTTRQTERRHSFAATAAMALLGVGAVLEPSSLALDGSLSAVTDPSRRPGACGSRARWRWLWLWRTLARRGGGDA